MPTIGERFKELAKHGVIFGLTSSLQSALSFILLPLYTNYLSVEEFGSYSMLLIISSICQCILYLGASTALGRYYYEYRDKGKEKEIVSSSLCVSFLGMAIQIVLTLLSANVVCEYYFHNNSLITPYILCLIAGSIGYPNLFSSIPNASVRPVTCPAANTIESHGITYVLSGTASSIRALVSGSKLKLLIL